MALALTAMVVLVGNDPPARRVAIEVACDDCKIVDTLALDVWTEVRAPGAPLAVVVSDRSLAALRAAGLSWTVIDRDIDATARAEAARLRAATVAADDGADTWYADYRDYRAVTARLANLVAKYPTRASLHGIGSTLDGQTIRALRIGPRDGTGTTPMLLNGTQHAREWISTMVTTCVAERLLGGYDDIESIRKFVDNTTLWVVPVVNPDGYQYSWSTDRYWRKNRRGGYGVDLNRNWTVGYGGSGSSSIKQSQVYRGERPFSENESTALRDLALREQIKVHVDFHSFGQLLMYPWMYSEKPVDNRAHYGATGDRMASAMFMQHQTHYRLVSGVETGNTGGTLTDWMHGISQAMSFTIELRPRGRGGFVLPPEEIIPTCDEGLAAVLTLRAAN